MDQTEYILPETDDILSQELLDLIAETPEVPAPAPEEPPVRKPERRKPKKKSVFYKIYWAVTILLFIGICCLMIPLRSWLVRYEASQPEYMCRQVFQDLFADPDWAVLYSLADVDDTPYENRDTYVAYMEQKVGTAELTCTETSAGLSGDHKYLIKLGDEKLASFTLTGSTNSDNITEWALGVVEVFFDRTQSVTVNKLPGQTVYINGTALDDSHTVRYTATTAEDYLPEGVHGYRMEQQTLTGLLIDPEITVFNADGSEAEMAADENGILTPVLYDHNPISQEEWDIAVGAAKADAKYSIYALGATGLREYFDPNSQVYKDLCDTPMYTQPYTGYSFDEALTEVSEFCRYSENVFSARVVLRLNVERASGGTKVFDLNKTYFFTKNSAGKYLVTNYSSASALDRTQQVRLTFMLGDQILDTQMVDAHADSISLPDITAPAGQVFKGWAVQEDDSSGKITMTIVLVPDGSGNAYHDPAAALEPMTLYPVFAAE